MRSVLGWTTTGVARKILNSANSKKAENLWESFVRCRKNERGHNECDEKAQVRQLILKKPVCRRFWKKPHDPSPREEKSRYERKEERERDYMGQWMAGAAHDARPTPTPCHFPEDSL